MQYRLQSFEIPLILVFGGVGVDGSCILDVVYITKLNATSPATPPQGLFLQIRVQLATKCDGIVVIG